MNSFLKKILVLTLFIVLAFPAGVGADTSPVTRISGANRYATAVEISKSGWSSSSVVVIARGDNYADALAGVPLAYRLGAPILLVEPDYLPAVTQQEIVRLGASRAIILGGVGAVSASVYSSFRGMGLEVERIAGTNRFDTAARIAAHVAPNGTQTVVVASGRNFPDALAAAPYAAVAGYPVLLVEQSSVPAAVTNAIRGLGVTETIVVGGTGVISNTVMSKLPSAHRISGADRYATSVALARHFDPLGENCYIATGRDFADAITGAVLAARQESGILLVGTTLPGVVRNYMGEGYIKKATILGGTGAVSATLASAILNILAPPADAGTTGVVGWTTPGATVKVSGKSVVASSDGSYKISGLTVGTHTAEFSLNGYETKTAIVDVAAGKFSVLNRELDVLFAERIYISGVVVDKSTARPLIGADVGFEVLTAGEWVQVASRKTDSNGRYTLANSDGDDIRLQFGDRVRLSIRKDSDALFQDGFHPVVITLDLKRDAIANIVDGVEMSRVKPMIIIGRVTKPDGTAVSGVAVTLYSGVRFITAQTNEQGDFSFRNITLPSGKYPILVDYVGNSDYAMYYKEASVAEGKDLTHNIRMVQGYEVNVDVKADKDGEIFASGVDNHAELIQGGTALAADAVKTIYNGKVLSFTWNRIAPGTYTVKIFGDYVVTKTFSITVSNSDYSSVNQRVSRAGAIRGTIRVEGDDGSALTEAKVELINSSGRVVESCLTGSDGKYMFGGLVGSSKYTVRASAPGYRTKASGQLMVQVNEAVIQDFGLSVIPPTARASGTVRTVGTLNPAAGATMTFRALKVPGYAQGSKVDSTVIKADGSYQIDIVPGAYTVVITDPGKHEALEATLSLTAGDVLDYKNFTLQPGGNAKLTVAVKDSLGRVISDVTLIDKWENTIKGSFSDGKTLFANLSAGTYTVLSQGNLHEDLEVAVTVAKGVSISRDYTLVASAIVQNVSFWVVGNNNQSLSSARVLVVSGSKQVAEGVTNSNGRLTLRLPAGIYTAKVYGDGYYMHLEEFGIANRDIVIPVIRLDKW